MGRDWESQLYFPHVRLDARTVTGLLESLLVAGLAPVSNQRDGDRYPAMEYIRVGVARVVVTADHVEELLRTKAPPLGPGYGVIPLRCREAWAGANGADAFLSFGRPDPTTELDSLMLAIDGTAFRDSAHNTVAAAFDRCFDWFALLAGHLKAFYGWGDWEDITFSVAPPTRVQVHAGEVRHLFRLNCFGPELIRRIGSERLRTVAARKIWLAHGAVVVGAGLVYRERGAAERGAVARALGLQPAAGLMGGAEET